jgi:sec-independent protein translocase protein TatC
MTLVEHLVELRTRMFYAALGVVAGFIVGYILSQTVFDLLKEPYCDLPGATDAAGQCRGFYQLSPATGFVIRLKIALWVGLIVSAPVWLFQLWAFIAPGLHRHERKWAYVFISIATPLFAGGAVLAYYVVSKGLEFLLDAGVTGTDAQLEVSSYISFVTNMLLLFGVGFEFPLILLMLNFTGVATARRLASWWRVVVMLCFAFAAIATPDPGPFGMLALAGALCLLYVIALGVAFLNDKRTGRDKEIYADLDDDEVSPIDEHLEPVTATDQVEVSGPVTASGAVTRSGPVQAPLPLERRFDEST